MSSIPPSVAAELEPLLPHPPDPSGTTNPWTIPMEALYRLFNPPVASTVAPAMCVLAGIYVVEIALAGWALWLRIRGGRGLKLYRVQSGLLIPATALLWLIVMSLVLLFLIAQALITFNMIQNGARDGLNVVRAMGWAMGHIMVYVMLLGLALSTSFSARAIRTEGIMAAKWTSYFNAFSIIIPIVILLGSMIPGIISEVSCQKLHNDYKALRRIGADAQETWQTDHTFNNQTVTIWIQGLDKIDHSRCWPLTRGLYGEFFIWVVLEIFGNIACYIALSRKLQGQIEILTRSAENYRALERKSVLPRSDVVEGGVGLPMSPNPELDLAQSKSLPYESYGKDLEVCPGQPDSTARCEMQRVKDQERRAKALKLGLLQLRWLSGLTFAATLGYFAECVIVLSQGKKGQKDPYWFTVENMLGLWIFAVIGGAGITILLISGLDPNRQSFLGINLHSAKSEDLDAGMPDAASGAVPSLSMMRRGPGSGSGSGRGGYEASVGEGSQASRWQGFATPTPPPMSQLKAPPPSHVRPDSTAYESYASHLSPS